MQPRVAAIVAHTSNEIAATAAPGGSGSDYTGMRPRLKDAMGQALFVRVYATPAGGRLNVPGWGDTVIAALEHNSDGTLDDSTTDRATAAEFPRLRDIGGYWMHRAIWPAETDPPQIAAELVERLRATGLVG
jgi:hypothetical protein